jgi:hypothetical protein
LFREEKNWRPARIALYSQEMHVPYPLNPTTY